VGNIAFCFTHSDIYDHMGSNFLWRDWYVCAKSSEIAFAPLFPFFFFGGLFFFGIPVLVYFAKKKTYSKTEYKFYKDRLEYAEGFWTAEKKTIKYDNVTETTLRRGII
jgi:hypothetical protein